MLVRFRKQSGRRGTGAVRRGFGSKRQETNTVPTRKQQPGEKQPYNNHTHPPTAAAYTTYFWLCNNNTPKMFHFSKMTPSPTHLVRVKHGLPGSRRGRGGTSSRRLRHALPRHSQRLGLAGEEGPGLLQETGVFAVRGEDKKPTWIHRER